MASDGTGVPRGAYLGVMHGRDVEFRNLSGTFDWLELPVRRHGGCGGHATLSDALLHANAALGSRDEHVPTACIDALADLVEEVGAAGFRAADRGRALLARTRFPAGWEFRTLQRRLLRELSVGHEDAVLLRRRTFLEEPGAETLLLAEIWPGSLPLDRLPTSLAYEGHDCTLTPVPAPPRPALAGSGEVIIRHTRDGAVVEACSFHEATLQPAYGVSETATHLLDIALRAGIGRVVMRGDCPEEVVRYGRALGIEVICHHN